MEISDELSLAELAATTYNTRPDRFALRSQSSPQARSKVLKNNGNNLENFWKAEPTAAVSYIYEFGTFRLDVAARLLRRAEDPVHLTPKLFDLLVFLLENKGRAISKEELLRNVWPDSFVSEENLSRHISSLRKTLGEGQDGQQLIATLPKFGYRFLEEVRVQAEAGEPAPAPQEPPCSDAAKGFSPPAAIAPTAPQTRTKFSLLAALGLALGMIGVFGAYQWRNPATNKAGSVPPRITPLTSFQNRESYPAFSPDDTQLAFTWDGEQGDNTDIYVKPVAGGTPRRLTTNPAAEVSPVWSPDGRTLAFMRISEQGAGIFQVPATGGAERELLTGFWSAGTAIPAGRLSWSPDGKLLAYAGTVGGKQQNLHLFLLSLETLETRQLTADAEDDRCPVFSPDGKTLAFIRGWDEIYLLSLTNPEPRRLTFDDKRIFGLAWTPDSQTIIFSSARAGHPTLWKVAATGSTPEALTPSGEQAGPLALSHQGTRLAYALTLNDSNIWQMPLTASSLSPPGVLISSTQNDTQPRFSPDGNSLVFVSHRSGNAELWRCDSQGQNSVQLTSFNGPLVGNPRFSPNGQQIAFDSNGNHRQSDIYLISANGGPPQRFTTDASTEIRPSWSHDGQWIYFGSNRSGEDQIWKQPSTGGSAVQVTKQGGREAIESPDGQFLYYTKKLNVAGIWRVPVAGVEEKQVFAQGIQGEWAVVQAGIFYVNRQAQPHPTVEFFDFATLQRKSIVTPEQAISGLTVSNNGQRLLWSQVDRKESDLMMVENFR